MKNLRKTKLSKKKLKNVHTFLPTWNLDHFNSDHFIIPYIFDNGSQPSNLIAGRNMQVNNKNTKQ